MNANDFKPNNKKALLAAGVQVAYEKSKKIIDGISVAHPSLAAPLTFIQANFGILLAYKQEKLNQVVEFILENPDIFTKDLFEKEDFQDGLVIFLDNYFKLRTDEKLKMAQNIFIDFSKDLKKPIYPLERYNDTLEKISNEGLQFLGFIDKVIPQLKKEYVSKKMKQNGNENNFEKFYPIYSKKSLNVFIEEYIEKQARTRMKSYKGSESLAKEKRIKDELREPFSLVKSELEQLGLAVSNDVSLGWSSNENFYNLTHYGRMFSSIIKPSEIYYFTNS